MEIGGVEVVDTLVVLIVIVDVVVVVVPVVVVVVDDGDDRDVSSFIPPVSVRFDSTGVGVVDDSVSLAVTPADDDVSIVVD